MFDINVEFQCDSRAWVLRFDLAAQYTMHEEFGLPPNEIVRKLIASDPRKDNMAKYLSQLAYCMTRSMDNPPTQKEIGRLAAHEVLLLRAAIQEAVIKSNRAVLGETPEATEKAPETGSGKNGTGAKPSSKPSTSSASRRRSSSGSGTRNTG